MKTNRRKFIRNSAMAGAVLGLNSIPMNLFSTALDDVIRIGIIGLDTSHAPAFAEFFNGGGTEPGLPGFKVVAAYPYGSKEIKASFETIPGYTKQIQAMGIEIVDSIKALLRKVDAVLLVTNDGRLHLEQAREVMKSGKPVYIDKPITASMSEAVTIYKEAKAKNTAVFSASSLRYLKNAQSVRNENKIGLVIGADTFSPAALEPSHPDLFWYGIHGVEILYTVMGKGCDTVTRFHTDDTDYVVGKWKDGRLGTFRGTRTGTHDYGGIAFGTEGNINLGPFEGYQAMLVKVGEFFRTGIPPVDPSETLEIYGFMEAADESRRRGGAPVSVDEVLKNAGLKL
ncbi:MAG: Gfo/Idh/MocA family oxidoreductase [Bacteroidales bacterium]|nr:Gfo/Idh/MocA family oxidoreductase [Bacteroidales bacterium]